MMPFPPCLSGQGTITLLSIYNAWCHAWTVIAINDFNTICT